MIVCVSDLHFGRRSYEHDRAMEQELIDCLHHLEADVDELVLLGDIFDYYIEYRHLIPKGLLRFQALLAEWTARGIPVTYLVGNHDPWHRDYFERELGVNVYRDPILRQAARWTVYLAHGDGISPANTIYYRIKPLLRSPFLVNLYRTLLPADTGVGLARWFSRTFADDVPDPEVIDDLRAHARRILREGPADLAILGHTHFPEIQRLAHGIYVNSGSWFFDQTFTVLDDTGVFLQKWNGKRPSLVEQIQVVKENPDA